MEIDPKIKNRTALKGYFVKNAVPTEGQFADFIESVFNKRDDGLVKAKNDPLSLEAAGDASGPKWAIKFYWDFDEDDPHWIFSLNPRANPADPATARQGFGVTDGQDSVRLFIDRATGRVGVGTSQPSETLEVEGRTKSGKLSIGPWPASPGNYVFFGTNAINQAVPQNYALLQQTTTGTAAGRTFLNSPVDIRFRIKNADRMVLANNGNVGIGTVTPGDKLDIHGGGIRFSGNPSMRVYGAVRATNQEAIVLGGNWQELEVKGRMIDWTGTNLHIGYANDHSSNYIEIGRRVGFTRILAGGGNKEAMRIADGLVTVNGTIRANAIQTRLYTRGGTGARALSTSNSWADFPDLSRTISLSAPANVLVFYEVAMNGGGKHLVTRLVVDNAEQRHSRSITGNTQYWSPSSVWIGTLSAGSHTIKVQYRTPQGGTNNPGGSDWQTRVLQVLVFGV